MLTFESLGDIPKGRKQVENVKYNSRPQRSKDQLYDLVEKAKVESKPYIRRLQLTPEPACILASEQQIYDVQRFCPSKTQRPSVFCVDTTFNIGDYYVTATTYKHPMLKYGRHPTMFGPCMLHMRRKRESYNFLASSLVSIEEDLSNVLAIGSDRDAALRKGMRPFFPLATWLSCKKHVEGDVTRKLVDLRIGELERKEFLLDIFGSDVRKEMGLVDSSSPEEFDSRLDSLYPVWVQREMDSRGVSREATTEFYSYFLTYIATDMKTTMIKPVREKVGLGENFFYDNDPESMNDRIKKRKGKGSRQLQWADCVDLLQQLSQEQQRNAERALIKEGPYRLSTECAYMGMPSANWLSLSEEQRHRRVSLFRSISTEAHSRRSSSHISTSSQPSRDTLSVEADVPAAVYSRRSSSHTSTSFLPSRDTLSVEADVPAAVYSRRSSSHVSTSSLPSPDTVFPAEQKDKLLSDDQDSDGLENAVFSAWSVTRSTNLTEVATRGMPQSVDRKPGTRRKSDKRPKNSPLHQRCTEDFSYRAPVSDDSGDAVEKYQLKWLKGTSVYVCYDCGKSMRPKSSDAQGRDVVPPTPFDLVLYRKELRMYKKPSGELTYSITPQNIHFHLKNACILKKNSNFTVENISISEAFQTSLTAVHFAHLRKEFGLTF